MTTRSKKQTKPRVDIYQTVTNKITQQLKAGVRPWVKPWNAEHAAGRITRPLRHNGLPYQGINILMLWASAEEQGFACPLWLTFQQAKQLGGTVRKGEKGSPVVYANTYTKEELADDGELESKSVPYLRSYTVFNAEQCDGLPSHYYALKEETRSMIERIESVAAFVQHTKAEIREGGNQASYNVKTDLIKMPQLEAFRDAESQAFTLCHELIHWTRHPSRLDRDLGRKRFGDAGYAMEELVAELGSCFVGADLAITPEVREDHASYLASWLQVLENDKRAIFSAASLASKAVEYLQGLQPQQTDK